jgi:hypothetical protein
MGVTLTYDGNSKAFDTYFVRGFDDPDELEFKVGLNDELSDGTLVQRIVGVRRIITIGIQATHPKADRAWLSQFLVGTVRSITYVNGISETVPVILHNPEDHSTVWLDDLEDLRYCEIKLRANEIISVVNPPPIWATWVQKTDPDGNGITDPDGNPVMVMV